MIIEALLTLVGGVASMFIWERCIRDRVSIHRINSPEDADTEGLLDLYQRLFPDDGTNYAPDEIIMILENSPAFSASRHVVVENIVLTARFRGEVVGFLLCHLYPERRKAIITYYGIDKQVAEARKSAAHKLLRRLRNTLLNGDNACDYLFFDLQGVDSTTTKGEASERKARPVRFKQSVKRFGMTAHILGFKYTCPRISLSHDTREYPFSLMCVPIGPSLPKRIPRKLVLEFLTFLFLDCYGDLYPVSDKRFKSHQNHLKQCLKNYEKGLPDEIPVE